MLYPFASLLRARIHLASINARLAEAHTPKVLGQPGYLQVVYRKLQRYSKPTLQPDKEVSM